MSDENLREICSAVVAGISSGCVSSNYINSLSRFSCLYGGRGPNIRHIPVYFFLCRTTGRVYERASEETSSNRSPWYSWTSWTSRPPWSSWRGRYSRTSWTGGSQRPPRFLWNSWCTWSKRSERILKINSFWNILLNYVLYFQFVPSVLQVILGWKVTKETMARTEWELKEAQGHQVHQVSSPSHQVHIDFERKACLHYEPNPQSIIFWRFL